MTKLYEYIMAAELSVNPNTPQILVSNNQESLYLPINSIYMHSISTD